MTTRAFLIVLAVVALLVAVAYMHRPRGTSAHVLPPLHGGR